MTDLSPAAQAVLDAVRVVPILLNDQQERIGIAAALRAAADQVVPEPDDAAKEAFSIAALRHRWQIRDQCLAIAAELEGAGVQSASSNPCPPSQHHFYA